MKIGDDVKVFLNGESPWATITNIIDSLHIKAKIDNHLVCNDMHGFKFGDEIPFVLINGCWEVCL